MLWCYGAHDACTAKASSVWTMVGLTRQGCAVRDTCRPCQQLMGQPTGLGAAKPGEHKSCTCVCRRMTLCCARAPSSKTLRLHHILPVRVTAWSCCCGCSSRWQVSERGHKQATLRSQTTPGPPPRKSEPGMHCTRAIQKAAPSGRSRAQRTGALSQLSAGQPLPAGLPAMRKERDGKRVREQALALLRVKFGSSEVAGGLKAAYPAVGEDVARLQNLDGRQVRHVLCRAVVLQRKAQHAGASQPVSKLHSIQDGSGWAA